MKQHRPDVTIELYRGTGREPTATLDLTYPWIARQSDHALVEIIATELAGELQKGKYRLLLSESGKEPIKRRWQSIVDGDDELRFRELRRNVDGIVRNWRVSQVSR